MSDKLVININGYEITILNLNSDLSQKLKKDFSYYLKSKFGVKKKLNILIKDQEILIPKNLISSHQSQNSITYDQGEIRYNDYYGKAVTLFDYKTETCEIFSLSNEMLHELIYIIILSRSGRFMDLNGLHKVHACGVTIKNKNLLLMMDSKGGKTSTFLELLRDDDAGIISDDSPVINRAGGVRSFPLRLGVESDEGLIAKFPYLKEDMFYDFQREHYARKKLISLSDFRNKVSVCDENILIQGFRSSYRNPVIKKVSKLKMLKYLFRNMIVGLGLPMIIEYFLRMSLKDAFENTTILISRTTAAINLLRSSDTYEIYLSNNIVENGIKLKEFLNEK